MIQNPNPLRSRIFLLGLVVLVLNDHYFKLAYPNWFTGKVSDFAGLFILPIFLSSLFNKCVKANYLCTALAFLIWKSPIVEPLITAGNAIGIPFHRTVDYSDLIALTILPLSYWYLTTIPVSGTINTRLAINTLAVISFIGLTATSMAPNFAGEINKSYKLKTTKSELLKELEGLNCEFRTEVSDTGDSLYVLKNLVVENDSIIRTAKFRIKEKANRTVLTIQRIETFGSHPALFPWGKRRELRKLAEKYIVEEIR